jgi:hypothetical protein
MPTQRACATFGCPHYTTRTYCSACEHERERERNAAPHRKLYSTWAWKCARQERFVLDDFTCVDCGWRDETETGEKLHGDHEPDLVDLLERGLNPFDPEHVRTRCHSCHSRKTAKKSWAPEKASMKVTDNTTGQHHAAPHDTELLAAQLVGKRSGALRELVLEAFGEAGATGLTDSEGSTRTTIYLYTFAPRRVELLSAGLVEKTDVRRPTPKGRGAVVWRITTAGRAVLAYLRGETAVVPPGEQLSMFTDNPKGEQ